MNVRSENDERCPCTVATIKFRSENGYIQCFVICAKTTLRQLIQSIVKSAILVVKSIEAPLKEMQILLFN